MATIPPPMASSTANWHWKNKTVTTWAKQWFDRELTSVIVNGEGTEVVGIERVVEVDGDVELVRVIAELGYSIILGADRERVMN